MVRPRGFESVMLVGLICVLIFVLLGSVDRMRESAEESVVRSEETALRIELLDRLSHRELYGGALPESANPLQWVARRPDAYIGERETMPTTGSVWYFDRLRQLLVYRFRSGRETCFRLVQQAEVANVQGSLAGVGLLRIDCDR